MPGEVAMETVKAKQLHDAIVCTVDLNALDRSNFQQFHP